MAITFNPADNAVTLSNGDLTATGNSSSVYHGVRVTESKTSGKFYFEFTFNALGNGTAIFGIANASAPLSYPGADTNGWGWCVNFLGNSYKYYNGIPTAYGSVPNNGDIIAFAVDLGAGKIWLAINNVWQNSGNPVTGANPMFSGLTGTLFAMVGLIGTTSQGSWNQTLAYTPPSGYSDYNYIPFYISGTLKENENDASGAAYDYAVIKRSDGTLLAAGTAAADGTYSEVTPDGTTEYDVVALDPNGVYNPKIIEGVTGVQ